MQGRIPSNGAQRGAQRPTQSRQILKQKVKLNQYQTEDTDLIPDQANQILMEQHQHGKHPASQQQYIDAAHASMQAMADDLHLQQQLAMQQQSKQLQQANLLAAAQEQSHLQPLHLPSANMN